MADSYEQVGLELHFSFCVHSQGLEWERDVVEARRSILLSDGVKFSMFVEYSNDSLDLSVGEFETGYCSRCLTRV